MLRFIRAMSKYYGKFSIKCFNNGHKNDLTIGLAILDPRSLMNINWMHQENHAHVWFIGLLNYFEWILLTARYWQWQKMQSRFPKSILNAQKKLEIKNCAFIWVISLCTVGKMVIKMPKFGYSTLGSILKLRYLACFCLFSTK